VERHGAMLRAHCHGRPPPPCVRHRCPARLARLRAGTAARRRRARRSVPRAGAEAQRASTTGTPPAQDRRGVGNALRRAGPTYFALSLMQMALKWYAVPGERRFAPNDARPGRDHDRPDSEQRAAMRMQVKQFTVPPESILIGRMHGIVAVVLEQLRADADWGAIAAEYAHGAAPANQLGQGEPTSSRAAVGRRRRLGGRRLGVSQRSATAIRRVPIQERLRPAISASSCPTGRARSPRVQNHSERPRPDCDRRRRRSPAPGRPPTRRLSRTVSPRSDPTVMPPPAPLPLCMEPEAMR
jgi:hypothetical protein